MTPVEALLRAVHLLDRRGEGGYKAAAFQKAAAAIADIDLGELERLAAVGRLTDIPGVGDKSAQIIADALAGKVPDYVAELEAGPTVEHSPAAMALREQLKGDCHSHSTWSDGGASIEEMARTAMAIGHEYLVLTDHSPRLTVAHGLSRDRLMQQLDVIDELRPQLGDFRLLTGMEVDILEDGSLDSSPDVLERLDVVVASVHSKLKMDREAMTRRMVLAVANPLVDILGHCTGRLIGKRPPSVFDHEIVFAACARFGVAVEINSRVERRDPPPELLASALELGCEFTIDSDAHATGQLEWQPYGCEQAVEAGIDPGLIWNTLGADDLLERTRRG